MKKAALIAFAVLLNLLAPNVNCEDKKDWTFDPKTSTLIPNYLGKVKKMSGKAIIGEKELKEGSKIYNNDLVQTSEKSYLVIEMIDLTLLTLGPLTDFKVESWSYRTKNDREAIFSILKGRWRAFIKSKSKDDDQLKIKTPLASMGVRGTELLVNVLNDKNKEITQVALIHGAIHLENSLTGKKQDMGPGDHVVITQNEKGVENSDLKLTKDELKKYQEFIEPEIPRLLDPVVMNTSNVDSQKTVIKDNLTESPNTQNLNIKTKSTKEILQELNNIREENRKK